MGAVGLLLFGNSGRLQAPAGEARVVSGLLDAIVLVLLVLTIEGEGEDENEDDQTDAKRGSTTTRRRLTGTPDFASGVNQTARERREVRGF